MVKDLGSHEFSAQNLGQIDKDLENQTDQMEKGSKLVQRENYLSTIDLINSASQGMCLKGILFDKGNIFEVLEDRDKVIEVVDEIEMSNPHSMTEKQVMSSSKAQDQVYSKLITKSGSSTQINGGGAVFGIGLSAAVKKASQEQNENAEESSNAEYYESRYKYILQPMTTFKFRPKDIRLNEDAVEALKKIEFQMKNGSQNNVEGLAQQFLKKFGSHIKLGTFLLGGNYVMKAHLTYTDKEKKNEAMRAVSDAVEARAEVVMLGMPVGGGFGHEQSSEEGSQHKSKHSEMKKDCLTEITKIGGPPESTYKQWQEGLAQSNKTWSVICSGQNLHPIWSLIRRNHWKEFGMNASVMAQILYSEYVKLVSQPCVEQSINDLGEDNVVGQQQKEIDEINNKFMNEIKEINQDAPSDQKDQDIEILQAMYRHLRELQRIKDEFIINSFSLNSWNRVLQECKTTQELFHRIASFVMRPGAQNQEQRAEVQQATRDIVDQGDFFTKASYKLTFASFLKANFIVDDKFNEAVTQTQMKEPSFLAFIGKFSNLMQKIQQNETQQILSHKTSTHLDQLLKEMLDHLDAQCDRKIGRSLDGLEEESYYIKQSKLSARGFHILLKILCVKYLDYDPERDILIWTFKHKILEEMRNQINESFTLLTKYLNDKTTPQSPDDIDKIAFAFLFHKAKSLCINDSKKLDALYVTLMDEWMRKSQVQPQENQIPLQITRSDLDRDDMMEILKHFLEGQASLEWIEEVLSMSPQEFEERKKAVIAREVEQDRKAFNQILDQTKLQKGDNSESSKICIEHEQKAIKLLGRDQKIDLFEARKVTNIPLYDLNSQEEMIQTEKERPMMIFHQILMKNPHAIRLQSKESLQQTKNNVQDESNSQIQEQDPNDYYDEQDDYGEQTKVDKQDAENQQTHITDQVNLSDSKAIHGLDILCNLYYASDHAVREMMTKNLHCSKNATPLILPTAEILLYPYLTTQLTWNSLNQKKEVAFNKGVNIFKYKCPIVSFIRVGDCQLSKSKLINDLFFDKRDTFMHVNICSNMEPKSKEVNGLIEIQWHTPASKKFEEGQISELTTILNLRGDAANLEQQVTILKQFSDLVVIVADSHKPFKGALFKVASPDERNFLWIGQQNDAPTNASVINQRFMQLSNQINDNQILKITQKIASIINPASKGSNLKNNSLETFGQLYESQKYGQLDTNNGLLKQAKQFAKQFEARADKYQKDHIVPLQSEALWGQYTENMKKLQRHSGQQAGAALQREIENLKKQCQSARNTQRRYARDLNPAMQYFVKVLNDVDPESTFYFIEYVTLYLNERNSKELKSINASYAAAFNRLQAAKSKKDAKQSEISACQSDVEVHGKQKIERSFGLEHVLRECGQIYECLSDLGDAQTLTNLPQGVAWLLRRGIAIEFMDGENAYVPAIWISSILNQLENICGAEQIHVQSIIGTQSSGKSTFLNCQYNSKFAVAAERCTKGIYFQLLEIDDECRKSVPNLKSKYVINLDTEGLRAPELVGNHSKSIKHDNEMGTLIISIADMTTLNVDGLSNVTSMTEILDIVVHAVLKIRDTVTMDPKIHFVHQKVDDSNPEESNREARLKITNALDANTRQTATILNKPNIQQFSDVIPTDTEASYVNSLFEGTPGNQAYSIQYLLKVQSLKMANLQNIAKTQGEDTYKGTSFQKFGEKLTKLWKSVLAENFSFAFQNASAISAFKEIEIIENRYYNEALDAVQSKKSKLDLLLDATDGYKTYTVQRINQEMMQLEQHLLSTLSEGIQQAVEQRVGETDNDTVKRYETTTLQNIQMLTSSLCQKATSSLVNKSKSYSLKGNIQAQNEEIKKQIKDQLVEYYKDHKDELQGEDDASLEQIFRDKFWKRQLKKFADSGALSAPKIDKDPGEDITKILGKEYSESGRAKTVFNELLQGGHLFATQFSNPLVFPKACLDGNFLNEDTFPQYVQYSGYKLVKKVVGLFSKVHQVAYEQHEELQGRLDLKCSELKNELTTKDYDEKLMRECLRKVDILVLDHNNRSEMKSYKFTHGYALRCKALLYQKLHESLAKQVQDELERSDPTKILEADLYENLKDEFEVMTKGLNANEAQATLCSKVFVALVQKKLRTETCRQHFYDDGKGDIPVFTSKRALVGRIMQDILDGKHSFEETRRYLARFDGFAVTTIRGELKKLLKREKVNEWALKYTTAMTTYVSSILRKSLETSHPTIGDWLPTVIALISAEKKEGEELRTALPIGLADFAKTVNLDHQLHDLDETVSTGLRETFLNTILKGLDPKVLHLSCDILQKSGALEVLAKSGLGCLRSCKFCGAPCEHIQPKHNGNCSSACHRIAGANGAYKSRSRLLITDANCNTDSQQKTRWTRGEQVFLDHKEFKKSTNEEGAEEVTEEIGKLAEVDRWTIDPDTTKESGEVFWQWYFVHFKADIERYYFERAEKPHLGYTRPPAEFGKEAELKQSAQGWLNATYGFAKREGELQEGILKKDQT